MFINMAKDPALSLLYGLISAASVVLSLSHYYFGHYNILLSNITIAGIFCFASIFSYLNRNRDYSNILSLFTLSAVALAMQYQLSIEPVLGINLIYSFPILVYFVLPLSWGVAVNTAVVISTLSQLLNHSDLYESLRQIIVLVLIGTCSLCYAYLNHLKQSNLLKLAVTDYQSGAYNIQHLQFKLQQEIARSQVNGRTLSLLAMSIDDYQQILEIHGRDTSEKTLKEIRMSFVRLLRAGDEIFHNGKGTFFILLPNCPKEGVIVLKERLLKHMDNIQWGDVGELQINAGFATLYKGEQASGFFQRAQEQVQQQQENALRLLAFN